MDMNNGFSTLFIIIGILFVAVVVIRSLTRGSYGGGRNMDPDAKVIGHRAEVVRDGKSITIRNSVTFSDGYVYVGYGGGTTEVVGYGLMKASQGLPSVLEIIGIAITNHDNTVKSWNKKAVKTGKTMIDIPELGLHGTLGELRKKICPQTWKCTYCGGETSLDKYECAHCGKHKV